MRARFIAAAAIVVLTAGCSDAVSGYASPDPAVLPRAGAPRVAHPLKVEAYQTKPCGAATNAEVESAGGKLESAEAEDIAGGRGCAWIFADLAGSVSGALNVSEPDGLTHLYGLKKQGSGLTTFKPLPDINGYPAVVFANGGEDSGTCNLAIGLRDDMMYYLVTRLYEGSPNYSDACAMTGKIATFVVRHLKEAQ